MKQLHIILFGNLSIRYDQKNIISGASSKALELFCYILLNRDGPHAREALASLLWGDHYTTVQSKKYLRKALWQLQVALNHGSGLAESVLLHVDPKWILLNSVDELWLDVALFEKAYAMVKGTPGQCLPDSSVRVLKEAIQLYRGNLLDGWYQDWCVCERERLQQIYLMMLDKLLDYCEAAGQYELGLVYGEGSLRYDRARECTHRQVMRLSYLIGDRTGAIRQYERCVVALKEELDLEPSARTQRLYELVCAGSCRGYCCSYPWAEPRAGASGAAGAQAA